MSEQEKILFGTDGIRGLAGEYPLDDRTVERLAKSLVANMAAELGRPPSLVIGRDTRESGSSIETALTRGALSQGARVELAGVITTPGVAYTARSVPFDAGVVISASHNPYQDNGIKVFSCTGKKISDAMERRIENDILSGRFPHDRGPYVPAEVNPVHCERYVSYLADEVSEGLSVHGIKVGLDCANGAASHIAPEVFRRIGADVHVLNAEPDGRNINENCGSLHPESLQQAVKQRSLALGIAFDGDADRALFVDPNGSLVDGDHVLLILADFLKSLGRLSGNAVVTTVMSNVGLELALADRGIEMVRTSVGDKYVLTELIARGAAIGGEQSGHIIFPKISLAGDGLITAIEVLRALAASGKTLTELAAGLVKYPQVLINQRVRSKPAIETLPGVTGEILSVEDELKGLGRVLVRYSGTENLARVMIEGKDKAKIEEQARRIADSIAREIG